MHTTLSIFTRLKLSRIIAVLILLVAVLPLRAQFSSVKPDIKEYKISSRILNQTRKITIYKPSVLPKYSEAVSPVFYALDGEMMAYFYSILVNYMCERAPGLPPITVVGIENEPTAFVGGFNSIGRDKDLTPLVAVDSSRYKTSGGAEKFLQFIKEELIPFVEKDYKKVPYRVLAGSSLGGWLALHSFLQHPGLFNGYIALSPAFHMNNNAYMKIVEESISKTTERNNRLFFSVGNEPGFYKPNARKIDSLLKKKNINGLTYRFEYYPKEGHATLKAMHEGFDYIFRRGESPEFENSTSDISYSKFEEYYSHLSEIFGYAMKPEEGVINQYGYYFLTQENNIDKALEFFRKNVVNYPLSPNVYDSYGEALLKKGDTKNALINYEKAFQLDPSNTAARDIVNKLRSSN